MMCAKFVCRENLSCIMHHTEWQRTATFLIENLHTEFINMLYVSHLIDKISNNYIVCSIVYVKYPLWCHC